MRLLAIGRELSSRGHEVTMIGDLEGVAWVFRQINLHGIEILKVEKDVLDFDSLSISFDLVIIDSYTIKSDEISKLNSRIPIVMLVDGDTRGIQATTFIDQNLNSENFYSMDMQRNCNFLLGSKYALIRPEVLSSKIPSPSTLTIVDATKILTFFGGSDPKGVSVTMAECLADLQLAELTMIAPAEYHTRIQEMDIKCNLTLIAESQNLPNLIATNDLVISAAGTSAWDISTIGTSAAYVLAADNQRLGIQAIEDCSIGITLGSQEYLESNKKEVQSKISNFIVDFPFRKEIFERNRKLFDGLGTARVASHIEELLVNLA
jgi:spore coat polysaccharide biosynthesis predicted glycosyltransferase SpsG